MLRLSILALACLLWACSADDKVPKTGSHVESRSQNATAKAHAGQSTPTAQNSKPPIAMALKSAPEPAVETEPDSDTLNHADKVLEYHNRAQKLLGQGMEADAVMTAAEIYQSAYKLPRLAPTKKHANSIPPPMGLFNDEDAKKITAAFQAMDKALTEMLAHYASLEKYVHDDSIRDNGKQGRVIIKKIGGAYAQFVAARQSWLTIVDKAASQAEAMLLYKHPLKRQIVAASKIFSQFREVGSLLATGDPQLALLKGCRQNIAELIASASAPPFTAKPALEREYRAFLKYAQNYADTLDRGINEGFHSIQKRELNVAAEATRKAYNRFAASVNRQDGP